MSRPDHAFQQLVAAVDYPMYVVTAAVPDERERSGCLVGFATQCSMDPPRMIVCLSRTNHTYRVAQRGGRIVEVPIDFVDRTLGTSKMSSNIVFEAMTLVTWWGIRDRLLRRRH